MIVIENITLKFTLFLYVSIEKKLLNGAIDLEVKRKNIEISKRSDFTIDIMETDKDHIHLLISYKPNISITSIVRKLKQETTINLWRVFGAFLSKHFWKEHTFWSDGYFACSIGEASPETIKRYIENQG